MASIYIYPPTVATVDTGDLATEAKQDEIIAELSLDIVDFMDTPLLEASSTNIPASAGTPVTVVSSLASDVKAIQFQDTTGEYIGIYSDPSGSPVLEAIINPGSDTVIRLELASGTEIGLRNMKNSAITVGDLALQFLG